MLSFICFDFPRLLSHIPINPIKFAQRGFTKSATFEESVPHIGRVFLYAYSSEIQSVLYIKGSEPAASRPNVACRCVL
jgi:hypothetical protein